MHSLFPSLPLRAFLLATLLAAATSPAFAQATTTWTAATDTSVSTAGNWTAGAPVNDLTSSIAAFSTGSLADPVLTTSQSVKGVIISTATTLSATGGSVLTLGASGLTNSANTTVSAVLAGSGGVTSTAGTLTLSGANTYSGTTTLSAGTLAINSAQAIGTGRLTFSGTSTLDNTSGAALVLSTDNAQSWSSNFTFTGTNSLNLGTGAVGFSNSRTVTVSASTLTVGGNISGSASFIKAGAGTLALSGSDSYRNLTVSAGTLQFGKVASLYNGNPANWGTTSIVVTSGATAAFNVGGTGEFTAAHLDTLKALGTGTGGFKNGSFLGIDTTNAGGSFTYDSAIANPNGGANTLGLTKLGTGTLLLPAAHTYTGTTTVKAGTLSVDGSLGSGSLVTVASGGTLGGSGTISGATTIQSGGTLAPGNSPVLLTFGSTLALAAGSTSAFEINGTGRSTTYDAIDVAGSTTLGGTLALSFGSTIASSTTLALFAFGGGESGVFDAVTASGLYSGSFVNDGGLWTLTSGGQSLTFSSATGDLSFASASSAVPEPATSAALAGLAACFVAVWSKRGARRRQATT